jgi:AraC-like DNA-binding protein
MTTALLARHPQVVTTDLDVARSAVAQRFCSHQLGLTRRGGRLDMVHNAAPIGGDVTLNYMRYGDEVRIVPGRFEDFFLVQVPLAGRARVQVGDRLVPSDPTRASIGSPTEHVDMTWEAGCEQLLVYLRRAAVEEVAGGAVVFDPMADLCAAPLRSWLRLVHLALDDIEAGGPLLSTPLVATQFEQTLISALLAAQPNSSVTAAPVVPIGSRAVRRVVAAIEAEPERAWRLADLAACAGVSARTLQEAFQRELGSTPLEQLRLVRLARARRDLLAADPRGTSVTEVAGRWGFFHLGRFSQVYRDTYQELPSQTLAG